jgi:hypothetical protein
MYLHKHISANNVSVDNFPFQREIAMEAYLIENPTVLQMETDGFNEVTIVESEVTLLDGRIDKNTDGRIDILAKYGQEYLAIVELKLGELTETHLKQIESYLKERQQILNKFPDVWDTSVSSQPKWIGVMIGGTINPDLMLKIRNGYYFENEIPIAALTINRYKGQDGNVYVVTDTYFIESVKNKDYTKYVFNGQKFGKNRLVLEVIKKYIEANPATTFSQLKVKFPDSLQGRETFTTEKEAKQKRDRRNFIEPDELITLTDETIAVSTQWGLKNIKPFIDHCRQLGFDIKITQ